MAVARDEVDLCYTEDALQFSCWNHHGPCVGRCTGSRLRKRGGGSSVEGDVALNLLHNLMDVSVQNRDRAKTLEVGE